MKNKLLMFLPLAAIALASCGSNPGWAGKSYSFQEIATTFTSCQESDVFGRNPFYESKEDYEDTIKEKLVSTANHRKMENGKLNISSTSVSNNSTYNGKETTLYNVNQMSVSEYEGDSLCTIGVDGANTKISHFYQGSLNSEGTIVCELFNFLRGNSSTETLTTKKSYKYLTVDNGIELDGSTLIINFVLTYEVTIDSEKTVYTCNTQVKMVA